MWGVLTETCLVDSWRLPNAPQLGVKDSDLGVMRDLLQVVVKKKYKKRQFGK